MSHFNCWMAVTNLAALFPLLQVKNDKLTLYSIIFAASASFISHLFESHKHGMIGFNCSHQISHLLNRIDVIGAVSLIVRIFIISKWTILLKYSIPVCFCGLFNLISEYDKSRATRDFFLITHSIWHIGIFITLYFLIKEVYDI